MPELIPSAKTKTSLTDRDATEIIKLRHPEWREWHLHHRWMMDSYEGGKRYRDAVYGWDVLHGVPIRNLIRHKREYPDPRESRSIIGGASIYPAGLATGAGAPDTGLSYAVDAAQFAQVSDYELRRARTPAPNFVAESIEVHLSTIYGAEVSRPDSTDQERIVSAKGVKKPRQRPDRPDTNPEVLRIWWEDVDGQGTPFDRWIEERIAPVFLVFGCIDIIIDHPPRPEGFEVRSRGDQVRLGLDRAVASYILPENMLWWRKDSAGRYTEVLVAEYVEEPTEEEVKENKRQFNAAKEDKRDDREADPVFRYRYWNSIGSCLINNAAEIMEEIPHPFGVVPIRRIFERRRPRSRNSGMSRYESTAENQREYYNRDSELILSDTLQAHPLLQGPEDFVQEDGTVPIGPGWLLPMKKNGQGQGVSYQGFSVIDFPKDGAESIRTNKQDIRDAVDRSNALTKPAGTSGTTANTVSQSGVSKSLDNQGGHRIASKIADSLAHLETVICELALLVLGDGVVNPGDVDAITIVYPKSFSLATGDELAKGLADFEMVMEGGANDCPETKALWLRKIVAAHLQGLPQDMADRIDEEIEAAVAARAAILGQFAEGGLDKLMREKPEDTEPAGTGESGSESTSGRAPSYQAFPAPFAVR